MTGRHVWWYFVAFFGFVAAVNVVMVTLAIQTHSGVFTEHPYEKGLAYNQLIEAKKKQEALGWKGSINYKNGALYFELSDKDSLPLAWEKATASFTRPTQKGIDFMVDLTGAETPVTLPAQGLWEVRVDTKIGETNYQQSKRIVVE